MGDDDDRPDGGFDNGFTSPDGEVDFGINGQLDEQFEQFFSRANGEDEEGITRRAPGNNGAFIARNPDGSKKGRGYSSTGPRAKRNPGTESLGRSATEKFSPDARHIKPGESGEPGNTPDNKRGSTKTRFPGFPSSRRNGRTIGSDGTGSNGRTNGNVASSAAATERTGPTLNTPLNPNRLRLLETREVKQFRIGNFTATSFEAAITGFKFNMNGDILVTMQIPSSNKEEAIGITDAMGIMLTFEVTKKSAFLRGSSSGESEN